MSDRKIILKDRGAYLQNSKWIPPVRDNGKVIAKGYTQTTETQIHSLLPYLGTEVETGENFTFEDFWNLLYPDLETYNVIFRENTGNHDLNMFHQDFLAETPETEENPESCIKYLIVTMCYEYDLDYMNDDGMILSRYVDFGGFGPNDGVDTHWAVEFTSLNVLKQYPFKIDNKVNIIKNGNKINGYKSENLLSENTTSIITVYDVISGILDEITFCGTPENRDATREDLICSVREIKEDIKNVKTLNSISELLNSNLKKDLE